MYDSATSTADIVMLGSFGLWTRGTLQARALPYAKATVEQTGLRVAIVTTPWDAPAAAGCHESIDGVQIYNTASVAPRQTASAVRQQQNLLRELQPRIVHVMKPKASAGITADCGLRFRSAPQIVVDYDDWEGDGGWNNAGSYSVLARRLFQYQERHLLQRAAAVTAASTLLEERAQRLRVRASGPTMFLPNGLESDWLGLLTSAGSSLMDSRSPRLLLYSRFAEFRTEWLVDVLIRLDARLQGTVPLDVVGNAPDLRLELPRFRRIIPIWHDFVPKPELPAILGAATVALYPYDDNLINRSKQSVKLLELMAAGCAVVASDVGDIRRIGSDAVVATPAGDTATITKETAALLENPQRSATAGRTAMERASSFAISKLAERLIALYDEMLGSKYAPAS